MARIQHVLTTPLTIDTMDGKKQSFDLMRIDRMTNQPMTISFWASVQNGCLDAGKWCASMLSASIQYDGAEYTALMAIGDEEKIETQIYIDMVAKKLIGPGKQEAY